MFKTLVQQSWRDIQLAVLGKGPYVLSTAYQHLPVKGSVWSDMKLPEREKHLAKLDTSNSFVEEEE
ncbi:hypothetical protein P5673_012323 [Acropora cervicornis]|uniref:Uncharacterized protein n=1 Tax=Acropora cervicornis TaxID=6130 RepID=A0AAD9QMM8_ACRCE|nr:hypothetical protein P5673_012323 [Acropora cervicornis]